MRFAGAFLMAVLLSPIGAAGQSVLRTSGDPLLLSGSAMDLPSLQGTGFRKFTVILPSISASASNSVMDAEALRSILVKGRLKQTAVDRIISGDGNALYFGSDVQFQLMGVGMNFLRSDSSAWLSIGLDHQERQLTTMRLDHELLELLYHGNKRFAGQAIVLDPILLRAITYRSIGGCAAFDIRIEQADLHIRPAIGIHLISSMQGLQFNGKHVTMYTGPDGRHVDIGSDYLLDMALPSDGAGIFDDQGRGTALDLSVGFDWKKRFQLHVGVNDMGAVRYTRGLRNFRHEGTSRYEGVDIALSDEYGDPEFRWDTLVSVFDPIRSQDAFTMRLPTTFLSYAQWALGESRKNGGTFPKHLVWGYLRRAMNDLHFTRGAIGGALGYTFVVADRFNLGTRITLPVQGDVLIGLHATIRAGAFRMGIASHDLAWVASPGTALGTHARLFLQLGF